MALRKTDSFVAMDLRDPAIDFLALGASMGLRTAQVTHPAGIDSTIVRMMAGAGPSLIEVIVEDGFGNT